MNIMRKFVSTQPQRTSDSHNHDNALGLMHLRKLFHEFKAVANGLSQKEQEEKLYSMLPLFIKVFSKTHSSEMTERFGDIIPFCSHVSKLMVNEIRRRASNQSTDTASCAIVKFLEIVSTEEASNGWMLLTVINLLSSGPPSLIDCMTNASLPSTLVKCLYLFFDLPDIEEEPSSPDCEFTAKERRILLQKVFVQVQVRLCSHSSPAEELARKDDLTLLFSAITSWCPAHNVPWRKSAAEVLMTLSRHGLTPNVVQYIHEKGCVAQCIDNMQRVQELSPLEIVEMFVSVFCFLKDSSEVSQVLLDDFRACQGYIFLSEFLLRLEQDISEEAEQALRNLVLLIGSLTTCGFVELKPSSSSTGSLFQMPGFTLPQPSGKGVSVRNIQAFQVLQSVFLKASTPHLCFTILDVINSIYHQDNANYFILEPQHTLSQFTEKIHQKPVEVQVKFFEIVEFLVFNLSFVPCKELISLSILIKTQSCVKCCTLALKSLLKIVKHHLVFKDVFREVGMLEVLVTCLLRYAEQVQPDPEQARASPVPDDEEELGFLVMEALAHTLNSNSSNAAVFRESGGARCSHNLVALEVCRQQALSIVQQLILSNSGEDDMGTLMGLMHSAEVDALELKTHILKALLTCLRESHRTRTMFRKVGGFVYVMSVLVSMEGCLSEPPKPPWDSVLRKDILTLLKAVFSTLTVAMRFEPANARFFATEVRYGSLTEAVRLLGCFNDEIDIQPLVPDGTGELMDEPPFDEFFCLLKESRLRLEVPKLLISACRMIRYLYDMALDAFDRPIQPPKPCTMKRATSGMENLLAVPSGGNANKRNSTGSMTITLSAMTPDPIVVHAGAVISILHLIPAISCPADLELELELKVQAAEVLKSLLKKERNQQVMCDAGMPHELLSHCREALANEAHPLHQPLQHIYERLAAQSLTPRDLRDFLRLGNPLSCVDLDEKFDEITLLSERPAKLYGGTVPLTRVKCLVSMTTPRDVRLHGTTLTPAFVEFDMNAEGFGCLYLPSISPQGPPTPSVVGVGVTGSLDTAIVGGIGTGERVFPPQYGFSYSTWLCVDKYCDVTSDAHPIRLLTIVRNVQGRDENMVCLNVYLSARDRALIASTQETSLQNLGGEVYYDPPLSENTVRFWCPELTQEGQWHHLLLIFHRAGIMKNSSISVYLDGEHVNTQKLHYISPNIGGGGTASPAAVTSVFAFVGTPPQLRRQSQVVWRQGPCHLVEDILSASIVSSVYQLGPNYVGCLQAVLQDENESTGPLISEDKVTFHLHARTMSLMTIAKIRKVYNKVDSKSIAKQLSMSAHENATPIRILHNSAAHLSGPARSLGGILMGYLGVRTFCPKPVAKQLENVGGTGALLGLIAMATDVEGLYAAVKALVCVVRNNNGAMKEMIRTRGYQTLAMLFKKKRHLMNSHILHLTFSLVGTVDSGRESSVIPNKTAFEDLLLDLEVWHEVPSDLQRSLYEHFFELLTESSDHQSNVNLMRELGLVTKLLHILKDTSLSPVTCQTIISVLHVLLQGAPDSDALLKFGQLIASTLPTFNDQSETEGERTAELIKIDDNDSPVFSDDFPGVVSFHTVRLRNLCLGLVLKLVLPTPDPNANNSTCDEFIRFLGVDWFLLFVQPQLHPSTVILGTRIIAHLLANSNCMSKFRDGTPGGGWLAQTEYVLQNRIGVLLAGFNLGPGGQQQQVPSTATGQKREINRDACHIPGFLALQHLLPKHAHIPELYLVLMALLLGQPVKEIPSNFQFDLDNVWTFLFGVPANQSIHSIQSIQRDFIRAEICPEAALTILAMVRAMLNQTLNDSPPACLKEYPVTLMQFLLYLYHNQPDFAPMCMTSEFLEGLGATLFPYRSQSENNSEMPSPIEEYKPLPGSDCSVVLVRTDSTTSSKGSNSALSQHPAKKFVMDFLRMIVVDSLSLNPAGKPASVIDVILEASPEHASRTQDREFQTEILKSLMDHLLAADALMGEQAALPLATGGSYANMPQNIFYFAARTVDKLWQGCYTRDANEIFYFISKLISQAKRRSSGISMDPIYKCLNRTVLYQLSRPMFNVAEQMNVLDSLHKLTSNRSLVFGPGNYEQEFFGCLCHCLLQLTEDAPPAGALDSPAHRRTTWHVESDFSVLEHDGVRGPEPSLKQGMVLIEKAAKRVWEELYVCKKPTIEEVFKVTLNCSDAKLGTPDLTTVRPIIQEPSHRTWLAYLENEKKSSFRESEKIQTQIQSKLQRMSSGVLRLASRKAKKDVPIRVSTASVQESCLWTISHVSIVKELVQCHYKQYQHSHEHMQKYLDEEWRQAETELLRERGLWGPPTGSRLDKWMLDMTEGPCRMRKKMMHNDMFYQFYPFRESEALKQFKYKVALSHDSEEYFQRRRAKSLIGEEIKMPSETRDNPQSEVEQEEQMLKNAEAILTRGKAKSTSEDDDLDLDVIPDYNEQISQEDQKTEENKTDNQTLLRLLEEGENITRMYRCARCQGLDTCEGLLLFGKEHFYVVDGFTLLKTKEITEIDSLPPELHEPIIPRTSNSGPSPGKRMCSKFSYEDIREVHKRRYLLQPIAIEVFSADGRNYLLAFPMKVRNKVYARFMALATAITDNAHQSVSGQRQNAKVEPGTGIISSFMGEKSVTQRWERGEISNFQYLMHLNTLAGRSYNDLMQYPVFPWILADYDSEELDLYSPSTFRDLSKPMGAQTPDRLRQFNKRYQDWEDPQGETPPYHYGTHYSSAMIVASYLVRMEPFSQHFLRLQGGHFDLADRMFHSVKEAWLSASKHNMADVKELIPEFFYLPEFLPNTNNFDFGAKQNGMLLDDVLLPTWAKCDYREFIRGHREALECDYVSAHLHEWIDLIFGYKQQGPASVEAVNVFHHLFYEGNVDIYSIEDPLRKNATIGFINNFGQIPKQLFRKPHPAKKLNLKCLDAPSMGPLIQPSADKLFFHNLDNLKPTMQPIKELKGAVGQIIHSDRYVQAVEQNKVLVPPQYGKYLAWGFADHSLRIGNYDSDKATMVFENVENGEVLCAACPNNKLIITAGTSTVVNVWQLGQGKDKRHLYLKEPLYGHTEPVTCLAASSAYNIILSGSRDRTCILWDMSRLVFVRQLTGHAAPVAAVCINELTMHNILADYITAGDTDSAVLIINHARTLTLEGDIATCAGTYLHVWGINGDEIASVNTATARNQQILCVAMSHMKEWSVSNVIMTGSSDGVVRMWSVEFVQVPDETQNLSREQSRVDPSVDIAASPKQEPTRQNNYNLNVDDRATLGSSAGSEGSKFERREEISDTENLQKITANARILTRRWSLQSENHPLSRKNSVVYEDVPENRNDIERASEALIELDCESRDSGNDDVSTVASRDDFVVVTEGLVQDAVISAVESMNQSMYPGKNMLHHLRQGFKWQRQLIFRSKLTMHTAFERSDNREPAAVTALAVSRDHKTVYVGDAKGRTYSWSVTDQPGRVAADHWIKDEGAENCLGCRVRFTFSERRHHCRNCGQVFCSRCSRFETEIRRLRILKPVRVCQACYATLRGAHHGAPSGNDSSSSSQ